ncbi:MAG: tRNA 4-thiouridine(8) synthase ThiI [Deltaproteobacteria bacterium]|nr:tRNA 4-thiouridine(8) synthase ThiI [Deltaproteobacteria bacterium]
MSKLRDPKAQTPPAPQTPEREGEAAGSRLALLRYGGELTTKASATRRRFVKQLVKNLKDALASEGIPGRVERTHNRLYVETHGPGDLAVLARCFGLQSVSIVEPHPFQTLEDVVEIGFERFGEAVRDRRFAVRARRVGEKAGVPFGSQDLARALGARLDTVARRVDLSDPEFTVYVELEPGRAYFFSETMKAEGGLPLGVEGRAVSLVSGGFDSAVASWMLLKRGVGLDYVFCNLGGRSHQLGTLRVMKQVADRWSYGQRPHLHAVDFDDVARELRERCETRYWQIILKRLMLRAGEMIARERRAQAIVTGEAVGQVSSQTLQNLSVISEATPLPILRPLIGFNKDEIIAIARHIGTEELSRVVGEYCAMVPSKPATSAELAVVVAEEERLDLSILERAVAERSVFDLRSLDLAKLDEPSLQIHSVPNGATVIDLRSKPAFQAWHYPEALHLDFANALRAYPSFDAEGHYVLYCEFGLKSAHLAELMRERGLSAHHFAGGLKELLDHARERGIPTPER